MMQSGGQRKPSARYGTTAFPCIMRPLATTPRDFENLKLILAKAITMIISMKSLIRFTLQLSIDKSANRCES